MRADNNGEGGILALLALVEPAARADEGAARRADRCDRCSGPVRRGAALRRRHDHAGDLGARRAVEGLEVADPRASRRYVVPITVRHPGRAVLGPAARHRRHRRASSARSCWSGSSPSRPLGLPWIVRQPAGARGASNPHYAVRFFVDHGEHGFLVLGSVVLCITGGEALYADMGHFGRTPIRLAWYVVVFPALLLNYFGQGALLLEHAGGGGEPVLRARAGCAGSTRWWSLATLATVIASQALISGAFSLTRQAVQLGYLPRVTVVHTSGKTEGQIYIPEVNWLLMVACLALVLGFRESSDARRRLRHRGHRHDGHHVDPVLRGRARSLGLVARAPAPRWSACSCRSTSRSSPPTSSRSRDGGWFPLAVGVGGVRR